MTENGITQAIAPIWDRLRGGLYRPVVLGALFGILFLPQIVRLVGVTWREPKYSHGFLIPLVSLFYLYTRREQVAAIERRPAGWGLIVVFVGILAWLWAQVQGVNVLAHASMLVVLTGMIVFSAGTRFLAGVAFPVFFLAFAFPVPKRLDYIYVVQPLQRLASKISEGAIDFLGIPVHRSGNIIEIPGMRLLVEEACSGIHSLYALAAGGTALAFGFLQVLPERRTWEKVALVVSTVPIAIFANVFRVTLTGILAYVASPGLAEGFFHYFSGLLVFLLGLVLVLLLAGLLRLWFPVAKAVEEE